MSRNANYLVKVGRFTVGELVGPGQMLARGSRTGTKVAVEEAKKMFCHVNFTQAQITFRKVA